jgi:hypothetical protein
MWSEREKDLVARYSPLEFRLTQWEAKCKTREVETMQEGKDRAGNGGALQEMG